MKRIGRHVAGYVLTGVVVTRLVLRCLDVTFEDAARGTAEEFPLSLFLLTGLLLIITVVYLAVCGVILLVMASRTSVRVRRNSLTVLAFLIPFAVGAWVVIRSSIDSKHPKTGFINLRGEWVIKPKYRFAAAFSEGYASVTFRGEWTGEGYRGAKWGLVDKEGNMVLKPMADGPLTVKSGRAAVVLYAKGKHRRPPWTWHYIEVPSGKKITEPRFDYAYDFNEGFAAVSIGQKMGLIDRSGKYLFEPRFEDVRPFRDGLALVKEHGLYGWVDTNGIVVVEPQYNHTHGFHDGLANVEKNGLGGYIDSSGRFAFTNRFDAVVWFYRGIASVKVGNKWGLINTQGKFILPPIMDESCTLYSESFDGTSIAVSIDSKHGFADTNGNIYCEPRYQLAFGALEGMGTVREKMGGKWAYVDRMGKQVTPFAFDDFSFFSEGLACVLIGATKKQFGNSSGGKQGYIDKTGEFVIPAKFDSASAFKNGYAKVMRDGRWGIIDKTGRFVVDPKFTDIGEFVDDLAPASIEQKSILERIGMNSKGREGSRK